MFRVTALIHDNLQPWKASTYNKKWNQHLNHRSSYSVFEYSELQHWYTSTYNAKKRTLTRKMKSAFKPLIELQHVSMSRVTAQIYDNLQHKKASTYKKKWNKHLNHQSSYIVLEYPKLQLSYTLTYNTRKLACTRKMKSTFKPPI
jgi:predicted N-acyltransferase